MASPRLLRDRLIELGLGPATPPDVASGRARLTALDGVDDPAADTVDLTAAVHAEHGRDLVHAAAAGLSTADRDLIVSILRHVSDYYVNLHNAQHPAGVVRAQLR